VQFHRLIPWFWIGALLAGSVLGVELVQRSHPFVEEAPSIRVDRPDGQLSVLWLGDIGGANDTTGTAMWTPPLHLARLRAWADADIAIINAESILGPAGPAPVFPLELRAPEVAVSLANTVTLDGQASVIARAVLAARAAGITFFGGGTHFVARVDGGLEPRQPDCRRPVRWCWEPDAPLLLRTPGGTLAVVAFAEDLNLRARASQDTAGFALLRKAVKHGISLARRSGADRVAAYVHWGADYREVHDRQQSWAHVFAEAGYDLVVGHHPRRLQPVVVIDGMPVVYSLGTFVGGGSPSVTDGHPGILLVTEMRPAGPDRLVFRCVRAGAGPGEPPLPCRHSEAVSVLGSLHPDIVVEGNAGILRWTGRRRGGGAP
jgi:hypothetical protein